MKREESFKALRQVLAGCNALHRGISSKPMFTYEEVGNRMLVYGISGDLTALYLTLQHRCYDWSLYLKNDDNGLFLECFCCL